jgi:hypothetical protein
MHGDSLGNFPIVKIGYDENETNPYLDLLG